MLFPAELNDTGFVVAVEGGPRKWQALILAVGFAKPSLAPADLDLNAVLERMAEMDRARAAQLVSYTCVRRYSLENERFGKKAEMVVRASYHSPGCKRLEVLSECGSATIRKRVFHKLLEAELAASEHNIRDGVQITPRNYDFRWVGNARLDGRESYVLEVFPKRESRFLITGRIWVDAEDFAIAQIEATPAKNPSVWTRQITITHRYSKFGPFWLPVSNRTESDVRIFGPTRLQIVYQGYDIQTGNDPANAPRRSDGPAGIGFGEKPPYPNLGSIISPVGRAP